MVSLKLSLFLILWSAERIKSIGSFSYSEAIKIESDFEIGEEVSDQLYLSQFTRRDVSHIKQNLKMLLLWIQVLFRHVQQLILNQQLYYFLLI